MTFHILALSGGGYRGLFTAQVLKLLEKQAGRPIGECFDLIAGTSIGGIIAIGLAMGKTAERITEVFADRGEKIFPYGEKPESRFGRWRLYRRMLREPKYDSVELRSAVDAVVGYGKLIRDAKTRLLIPAVNMSKGSVQMFKTAHHPNFKLDKDRKAADVALATSAAPIYFPMAEVGDSYFVDGGIVANAPDLCALLEAKHFLGQKQEDIRILSIGTTTTKFSLPSSLGRKFGVAAWMANFRLTSTVSSAQQQLVDFMMQHELGDRYLRIDTVPSVEQTVDLGLDLATESRRKTLLGLAEGEFQRVIANGKIKEFLEHKPEAPTFFN